MGADSLSWALRAAEYVGVQLSETQTEQLVLYHEWLAAEGAKAGGIGPHEKDRIWRRHIADSLVFGLEMAGTSTCLDIGTGVGLPGIPLAVAFPETEYVLLDRSGRRCDLARRAVAILRLSNCVVRQAEIETLGGRYASIVSRAAIPPNLMVIHVKRLLQAGGVAVLALSHGEPVAIEVPDDDELDIAVVEIPVEILDSAANLLRIEAT